MRNIEALKNYFLGKDPQLKETMADNSLRLIGIPGREFVLRAEVLQRLKKLRDELTEKDEEQQEQIDDLIEDVEALTTWKTNNDFVFVQDLNIALSRYYTKEQVDEIVSIIPKFDIEVVETLPTEDISETTIYLVPNGSNPLSGDYYDEYIYVNDQWEHIGSTAVDLSNYYTKTEINEMFSEQAQDTKDVYASGTGTISKSVTDSLNEKIGFTGIDVNFIDEDRSSYVCNGTEVAGTRYYFADYSRINASKSLPKSYYSFQMPSVVEGDVISYSYSEKKLYLNGTSFVYPSSSYNEPQYERLVFKHTISEPSGTYTLTLSNSDSSQTQEETITWSDNLAKSIVLRNGVFQYRRPYKKIDSYNGEAITTTDWYSNFGDLLPGATVYYEDAEYVDITDEILLEKLNNIVSFSTYEGTTVFSMTTQDSNSHSFYLSYQRTLKALIAENSAHYFQTYQTKSNILIATNSRLVSDTYYPSTGYMFKFLDQVEGKIPTITSSTTDIGAGSALATGDIYFVYE